MRRLVLASATLLALVLALAATLLRASNLVTFTLVGQYGPLNAVDSNLVGIDWLPGLPNQDQLLVSRNWDLGDPDVFGRVTASSGAVAPWGTTLTNDTVKSYRDEIYFSSVRSGQGPNWRVGDVFSAQTETPDGSDGLASRVNIARFRSDGTMVREDFAVLAGENKFKRGAVRFDYAGVANHALIVVASFDHVGPSSVYLIQSTGQDDAAVGIVTHLVDVSEHLEGLTTIPNNPAVYGPLAGKIVVGAEDATPPSLAIIDPVTAVVSYMPLAMADGTPIKVEDLWVVPPFSTFYGVDFPDVNPQAAIWKIDASQWQAMGAVGKLLIAQEYNAPLYLLNWTGSAFVATRIYDGGSGSGGNPAHWEHITFVPTPTPKITIKKYTNGADANDPNGSDVPNLAPGSTITWTYVVTNIGNTQVNQADVNVTDNTTGVTPAFDHEQTGNGDTVFDPGEVWIYTATGTALDLSLSPPAGVHTVANACMASGTQPPRTAYTNLGTATIPGATASDPSSYCNPPGSFTVTKSPKGGIYNVGQNVSFTMVVTSTGPGTALNVVLSDPLPTLGNLNTWIISSDPSGVCTIASNTLTCNYGNLANGATRTVTVSTNAAGGANLSACPGGVTLNNTATVTSSGLPPKTDTGDYTCTPPGSISLSKTPDGGTFNSGQQINFTLVVSSNGPGPASNVTLNDPMPTTGGLTWGVTSITPAGTCSINGAQVLNCSFGTLPAGATRTVIVTTNNVGGTPAAACNAGTINNTGTVSATGLPDFSDTGSYTCNVCQVSAGQVEFNKNNALFTVFNGNATDVSLSQVVLNWPTTNGKLMKILMGANTVYDTPDLPAPSATITTFQGTLASRTIPAGGSAVVTIQFQNNASINAGLYSGTFSFGNCPVTFPPQNACVLGYPYTSSNPKTSLIFNESTVLQQINPLVAMAGGTIQVYATDEHAPLLGVRTGSMPVSAMPANPGHVTSPLVGDPSITDPSGRPIHPGLYITDVTGLSDNATHTDPTIRAGDWQYCSPNCLGIPPNDVFGTWKGAIVSGTTLTTDADPSVKNNWNLGAGSDTPSGGFSSLTPLGYGTEFRWNVNALSLLPGHTYRVQVIVHDGDQNKTGGDVGQACATIQIK